jgi:hypothetical protein
MSPGKRLLRAAGLSLWTPGSDWLQTIIHGPKYSPSQLWLNGLGHLGQAYLWGLGLLLYPDPTNLHLVLRDIDIATPSTESTSILTEARMVGVKKTRLMAGWAERRGFTTAITERLFGEHTRRLPGEPGVALCGMDNAAGRRALDLAGFHFVVEAGLGRGHQDFRTLLLHILPGKQSAAEIWREDGGHGHTSEEVAAYRKLLADGTLDQCGITLLAGKAVGAVRRRPHSHPGPYEVLRLLHGGTIHRLINMTSTSITTRRCRRHAILRAEPRVRHSEPAVRTGWRSLAFSKGCPFL